MKINRIIMKIIFVLIMVFSLCNCKFDLKVDFSKISLNSCLKGKKINKEKWRKIEIGINKIELKRLLGPPIGESIILLNGQIQYEYWQYEQYRGPFILISSKKINFVKDYKKKDYSVTIYSLNELEDVRPCENAYVVFFDKEEKVMSIKKPRLEFFKNEFKEENWSLLELGMNKERVSILLGAPLSITKNMKKENKNYYEFWEYKNTTHLVMQIPSAEAFVVTFDNNGLLKSFLSPNVNESYSYRANGTRS